MLPRPWIIKWPDGSVTTARSSYEFLVRLGKQQRFEPLDHQGMKTELSRRARNYPGGTGQYIHPHQPDKPFLIELARVGLFKIEQIGDV